MSPHCTLVTAEKRFTHLLAACVLVNTTCMIISWSSQWCERGLVPLNQIVLGHVGYCVHTTSHHNGIGTDLDRTVIISMANCKRPLVGRRAVHGNPFGGL